MDYPKLISEKWNLTAKFNCLQAIYFDAPSALAVPMCDKSVGKLNVGKPNVLLRLLRVIAVHTNSSKRMVVRYLRKTCAVTVLDLVITEAYLGYVNSCPFA